MDTNWIALRLTPAGLDTLWHVCSVGPVRLLCIIGKQAQQTEQCSLLNRRHNVTWWGFVPPGPSLVRLRRSSPWRRPSQIEPNVNKRMLINDLISVPHHTADDKFGDGRPGGTTCGFPPLFGAVRSGGGGHQSRAELLSGLSRGAVRDKGGSG